MTVAPPSGVICPLATPLTDDEEVDVPALRRLVERLVPDVDGFLVLGSSGEYALLRPFVAQQAVDTVLEQVAGRRPLYVGTGDTGTARVLDNLSRVSPDIKAVVVTSGFYYPASEQRSLVRHFREIADAAAKPVVLYNIPQNTAGHLAPASVWELAEHPGIIGLKDSWGDMIQFQSFLAGVPADFAILQGREELTSASRWIGAAGVVSALANLAPHLLRRVIDCVDAGDRLGARAAQREVDAAAQVFAQGHWLSALKEALAALGFGSARAARPLPALSTGQREAVHRLVSGPLLVGAA